MVGEAPRLFDIKRDEGDILFRLCPPFGDSINAGILHELHTSLTFMELLRPGDVVFDIGANIGYYTILSNAIMKGKGRVFSFEPNPFVFQKLVRNKMANSPECIELFNIAVSHKNGAADLCLNGDDTGLSRIVEGDERSAGEMVSCATMTLDDIVKNLGIDNIRLLKIDVEGHEKSVILGGQNTFGRRMPEYIVCEINRGELPRNGCSEEVIRRTFETIGYDCELINATTVDLCGEGRSRRPYPLPQKIETEIVFNILFKRK